ncbi:MAG: carbohydrate ABC transporter permease [Oscillospiraceae bacterium]|nr:carbohydrate ABC transporter permease [Oscillospiraceae bacterium]
MTNKKFPLGEVQQLRLARMAKKVTGGLFKAVLLTGLCFVMLYPVLYILSYGFRSVSDLYNPSVVWLPRDFSLVPFEIAMETLDYWNSLSKTLLVLIPSVLFQLAATFLAGYGFSRAKFFGRGLMFGLLLFTIIVPAQTYIIPLYVNMKHFDWFGIGSLAGLFTGKQLVTNLLDQPALFWLQAIFGMGIRSGLCVFIVRQFFRGIPMELEEAAMIDGCGPVRTFLSVMLPNARSLAATGLVFSVVCYWNDFTLTGIFFPTEFPLSVNLTNLRSLLGSTSQAVQGVAGISGQDLLLLREPALACGCLLSILPIVLFYVLVQRNFIEGAERSGIVG